MKTLELWQNGNKFIGINEIDGSLVVVSSVFDGTKNQIVGRQKAASPKSAQRIVANRIKDAASVGTPGEYVKVY